MVKLMWDLLGLFSKRTIENKIMERKPYVKQVEVHGHAVRKFWTVF